VGERDIIARMISYRIQEEAFGGLVVASRSCRLPSYSTPRQHGPVQTRRWGGAEHRPPSLPKRDDGEGTHEVDFGFDRRRFYQLLRHGQEAFCSLKSDLDVGLHGLPATM